MVGESPQHSTRTYNSTHRLIKQRCHQTTVNDSFVSTQGPSKVNETPSFALVVLNSDQSSHGELSRSAKGPGSEIVHPHLIRNVGVRSTLVPIVLVFPTAQFLEK